MARQRSALWLLVSLSGCGIVDSTEGHDGRQAHLGTDDTPWADEFIDVLGGVPAAEHRRIMRLERRPGGEIFTEVDQAAVSATANGTGWDASHPPPPLLTPRGLYASGFDARHPVMSDMTVTSEVWTWTEETEREFSTMYAAVQYPKVCEKSRAFLAVKPDWGLFSRIRDAMDIAFFSWVSGNTTFFDGDGQCPADRSSDKYMFCLFEPLSGCTWNNITSSGVESMLRRSDAFEDPRRVASIWTRLLSKGLRLSDAWGSKNHTCQPCFDRAAQHQKACEGINHTACDAPAAATEPACKLWREYRCAEKLSSKSQPMLLELQRQQGIIRALFAGVVFNPQPTIREKVRQLNLQMGNVTLPMLAVHARRTDKAGDHVDLLRQESTADPANEVFVLEKLVAAAERLSGLRFRSIFLLTDDPGLALSLEALTSLSKAGALNPPVLQTNLTGRLSNISGIRTRGRNSLDAKAQTDMNEDLLASVFWAADHASYVVGNGKSGLSQFLTQLLGAKYRSDPNMFALMEDDLVTLENLNETQDVAWLLANP